MSNRPPRSPSRLRAVLPLLIAVLLLPEAHAQTPPSGEALSLEASAEPTPLPAAERLEALEAEIEAAESAATPATAERLGLSEERLNERGERLRALAGALRQQVTLGERFEELAREEEALEKDIEAYQETGGAESGPPTIRLADKLRDEADTARRQTENLELTLEIAEEEHEQGLERLREVQRAHREAVEAAQASTDPGESPRLQWEANHTEVGERLAQTESENRQLRKELTEQELQISRKRMEFLGDRAETVASRSLFTSQELQEQLDEADLKRDAVERSLAELRDTHRANDARRDEAREALDAARGEAQIAQRTAELATRTAWADTSARILELAEKQVELHRTERVLWQRRYLVAQGKSDEELGEWLIETTRFLEEIERDRKVQESRLLDIKANLAGVQRQLDQGE